MSYELIGILFLGVLSLVEVVGLGIIMRGLREISRIQRAIAGLIVQESERIPALLRETPGR